MNIRDLVDNNVNIENLFLWEDLIKKDVESVQTSDDVALTSLFQEVIKRENNTTYPVTKKLLKILTYSQVYSLMKNRVFVMNQIAQRVLLSQFCPEFPNVVARMFTCPKEIYRTCEEHRALLPSIMSSLSNTQFLKFITLMAQSNSGKYAAVRQLFNYGFFSAEQIELGRDFLCDKHKPIGFNCLSVEDYRKLCTLQRSDVNISEALQYVHGGNIQFRNAINQLSGEEWVNLVDACSNHEQALKVIFDATEVVLWEKLCKKPENVSFFICEKTVLKFCSSSSKFWEALAPHIASPGMMCKLSVEHLQCCFLSLGFKTPRKLLNSMTVEQYLYFLNGYIPNTSTDFTDFVAQMMIPLIYRTNNNFFEAVEKIPLERKRQWNIERIHFSEQHEDEDEYLATSFKVAQSYWEEMMGVVEMGVPDNLNYEKN